MTDARHALSQTAPGDHVILVYEDRAELYAFVAPSEWRRQEVVDAPRTRSVIRGRERLAEAVGAGAAPPKSPASSRP